MAAREDTSRGYKEGDWLDWDDPEAWEKLFPLVGDVLEFDTELVLASGGAGTVGACLITSVSRERADGVVIYGRFVGSNNEEVAQLMSNHMNRRKLPLHLCWENPCRGKSVLKEYTKAYGRDGEDEDEEEDEPPVMRRPAAKTTKVRVGRGAGLKKKPRGEAAEEEDEASKKRRKKPVEEVEEEAPEETGPGKGEEGRRKDLRAKVAALRTKLTGRGAGRPSAPILVPDDSEEESTGYSASVLGEGGLHTGEMLRPRPGQEALRDLMDPPEEKKRKVRKKKETAAGTMTAQLPAQAEHAQGLDAGERMKKKKRIKGGGDAGKVKELVKLLRGDPSGELTKVKKEPSEKKKKKKKKKGKRKKKRGGGDPSGSSGDSSSEDSSGGSRRDEESSSSSSTDFRAPLQRRSAKKPGTVLRMLVDHARAVMDQSSLLATGSKEVTSGVKVSSYFNLMIRPYHASSSRDMKELHHLAVCIDELRGGTLARLGDSLASIPRHSYGGERGDMAECAVPGDAPTGTGAGRPHRPPSGSKEAWEDDRQEQVERGVGAPKGRRRLLARVSLEGRRKGPRKNRQRKGEQQRRRPGKRLGQARPMDQDKVDAEELVGRQPGSRPRQGREEGHPEGGRERPLEEQGGRLGGHYEPRRGLDDFLRVVEAGHSMAQIGCVLAWLAVNALPGTADQPFWGAFQFVLAQGSAGTRAVHRLPKRETFPLRLGDLEELVKALACPFEDAMDGRFVSMWSVHSWTYLSLLFCNSLHGCRGVPMGRWRRAEVTAVSTLRATVQRTLRLDMPVERSAEAVENELSSRFVSYTGEEVPKMELLSFERIEPALPPPGHGGSIPVTDWTRGRTRTFLNHPELCVKPDTGQPLPKLQAKVHVEDGERMKVAEALVSRGICNWVELDRVLVYRGTRVLNGLFGVGKSSTLPDGRCTLRVIMNLIPSNAVMEQLSGAVAHLPSITQYLSISLSENEELRLHQSDMTSAFYLFSMPRCWQSYMAFNLVVTGKAIQRDPQQLYALSCAVLPMGWSSAVSVMQEVSQNLLAELPADAQVSKLKPLPPWLPGLLTQSRATRKAWWHVYLDNFFSGEKVTDAGEPNEAGEFHMMAEQAWNSAGVLSSEKKKVFGAPHVQELGAVMDGTGKSLGVSTERLTKLLQSTALVLSKEKLPKKWLQGICGRWVHVLQFRRAGMAALHWVWKWIGDKRLTGAQKLKARGELFNLMTGACLFHTFLGAKLSTFATASDASSTGGAVGMSQTLTPQGESFTRSGEQGSTSLVSAPIIVLSMFNGIGGAFRAYDLLGLEVQALIGYDVSKPANRICSRRWPHAILGGDVRSITRQTVIDWLLKFPQAEELHLWAGFPCVDLSRVKAGRLNLDGPHSSLFKEILRVLELIRRSGPPPQPAGLNRTPEAARMRWRSDSWAYPPYQYKDDYVLWSDRGWRLINARERELLHGYGWDHTALALSASMIKRSPSEYEDLRCSLVGDSFSMYSFAIFAWAACKPLCPHLTYEQLAKRMGMAPGFAAAQHLTCELSRGLVYGTEMGPPKSPVDLCRVLLTRVNHTGSDVRVTSGQSTLAMVRPRAFAGTRNRVERRKARKGIILRDVGISKKTQERYYNAVAKLLPVIESCQSMEAMDEVISDWIEREFSKGMPLNTAADALSGIHYFIPASKKKLPSSWKLFATWRRFETPARAPPITKELVWAMCQSAFRTATSIWRRCWGLVFTVSYVQENCWPLGRIEVHQVDLLGTKVSKVEADFGKVQSNISEIMGVLHQRAAGKTSTLSILTGAILPSAGKAFLGGFDVVQEQRKVRRLLGYCPQHDALLDRLTVPQMNSK
eukprot:s4562_g4.t1